VFVRSGSVWSQQAYLKASNTGAGDNFGTSVAVSGDTAVVGAVREQSNATGVNGNQTDNSANFSGAAYVFVRSGGVWSQQAYLKASNTEVNDMFGSSVAVTGDTAVVGALGEDSSATGVNGNEADNGQPNSGACYVFVRSGSTWSQQAYLKSSNAGNNDQFGASIAISGDTLAVGAFGENSNATGVNGNQANNSTVFAGACYVFVHSDGSWSQVAYLKASSSDAVDRFGASIAISGDTLVVGAYAEDSSATGVDGDDTDDSALDAGAAYVFDLRSGCVGANGRPSLSEANVPQIGQPYTLDVANLETTFNLAVMMFGFAQFPLPGVDLGGILDMPGCDLYHSADVLLSALPGAGGAAQWDWTVSGLPGDTFYCQALCLDPAANAFGWTISNQVTITLVP
jgi:hypothetical protein